MSKEAKPKAIEKPKHLWSRYRVKWTFPNNLCGSIPKDPNVIEGWLNARRPKVKQPNSKSIPEIQAEIAETLINQETPEDELDRSWLTFQRINNEIVMRAATVRAHFKDCARIVGKQFVGKISGESGLGWKITNGLYVEEYFIPVLRDGKPVTEISGSMDKNLHVMTARGPISALKRIDFVTNVTMTFTLRILAGISMSDVETIMQYGAFHGYAGERSESEGRYLYTIEALEE